VEGILEGARPLGAAEPDGAMFSHIWKSRFCRDVVGSHLRGDRVTRLEARMNRLTGDLFKVKRARYWIEWLLVSFSARLIPLMPLRLLRAISEFAASLVFVFDRKSRAVAVANLEMAYGSELTPEQRNLIAKRSFQAFGKNLLELFWTPRLTRDNLEKYVSAEDPHRLHELAKSETPYIAITPHFGNIELAGSFLGYRGKQCMVIAQPLKNERLTPIVRRLREGSGHRIVDPENAVVRLVKALRDGTSVFLLTDLTLKLRDSAVVIEEFGLKTRVTQLHAFLHLRTGIPILPFVTLPRGDGAYQVRFLTELRFPSDTSYQEVTQACWNQFEPIIRSHPEYWLWLYKHWRYRPSTAVRPYPFYANHSVQFDLEIESQEHPERAKLLGEQIREYAKWRRNNE
jgi:Kdo2-lipid IVA lauroyltransferase/acyltransferase